MKERTTSPDVVLKFYYPEGVPSYGGAIYHIAQVIYYISGGIFHFPVSENITGHFYITELC